MVLAADWTDDTDFCFATEIAEGTEEIDIVARDQNRMMQPKLQIPSIRELL